MVIVIVVEQAKKKAKKTKAQPFKGAKNKVVRKKRKRRRRRRRRRHEQYLDAVMLCQSVDGRERFLQWCLRYIARVIVHKHDNARFSSPELCVCSVRARKVLQGWCRGGIDSHNQDRET